MANSDKFLDLEQLAYFKTKTDAAYVAQVSGKGLSTNDFTDAYKNKVDAADEKTTAVVDGSTGAYTLKKSTTTTVGGVKIGEVIESTTGYTGVKIDSNGVAYYHDTTYSNATPSTSGIGGTAGLMSPVDKEIINGLDDTYAKKTDISGIYKFKGTVDNYDSLPASDNADGDVYNVRYRYNLLDAQPGDWTTNYTDYYTKSGSTYSSVTGESAPTFATNIYYKRYDDGTNYAWKTESLISAWDALGGTFEIAKITSGDIDALFS